MLANLNYIHIAVATLVYFIIGSLWYSLLFGKIWVAILGLVVTEEDKKKMPQMFATTFVLNFVITFSVACILHFVQPSSVVGAIKVGLVLGAGLSGTTTAMSNMYARRPLKLTLIDTGYHILSICVVSVILTLWQ
jgi:hypothetical protein